MGGHGGLNILPQKRWNVYNFDNREKVRKDEEAAAKEEQLKQEQVRKRDAEFRLEQLRTARGLAPMQKAAEPISEPAENITKPVEAKLVEEAEPKSNHINLFEGIKIFDPIKVSKHEENVERDGFKKNKKMKKEEVRVVGPEDEKYRLGYGVAGKGVKLPWYLERPNEDANVDSKGEDRLTRGAKDDGKRSGKKTLEELREERLKREKREKERERTLLLEKRRKERDLARDRRFSRK